MMTTIPKTMVVVISSPKTSTPPIPATIGITYVVMIARCRAEALDIVKGQQQAEKSTHHRRVKQAEDTCAVHAAEIKTNRQ